MLIEVRYYSPTATKGSRFRLFRDNKAITPFIGMDYKYNTMKEQSVYVINEMYPHLDVGNVVDKSIYSKESTEFTLI